MTAQTLLIDAAAHHVLINPVSPIYARQVEARCRAFAEWVEAPLTIAAIVASPSLLSAFLIHLETKGLTAVSVRGYRACILATCHSVIGAPTIGPHVRRVKRSSGPPTCWTTDELRALLQAATLAPGERLDAVPWSTWWPALIHTAYSTGQRLADLLAAHRKEIKADGVWTLQQQKTKKQITVRLSPEALNYGQKIGSSGLWLPWPYSGFTLRKRFGQLVQSAGIRPGTLKWIRRTAGTYFEAANPGGGHRLLGNTRQVFDEAYHDRTITQPLPLQAPGLT